MKKVWKYISITLLLLLGLCCVGVLYLFFIPNSNIFGLTYISNNTKYYSEEVEASSVNTIVVNSNAYKVNVVESQNEKISILVYDNSFGFTLTKYEKASISAKMSASTLTFNISEPVGAVLANSSFVELRIPKDATGISLELNNNKARTSIESAITIQNLSYLTSKGNLDISNCTINGQINLTLAKATATLHSTAKTNSNNINLNITTGKFDASQISTTLGNITISNNERAVILLNECLSLKETLDIAGGRIEAKKINHVEIVSTDTNVYIKEVTDGATIILKSGTIEINSLSGSSDLQTADGNISINIVYSNVKAETTSAGNITINAAYKTVIANTSNGTIVVNFHKDAGSYSTTETNRELISTISDNGNLTANGVEHAEILAERNGRINVTMQNIKGANTIEGKESSEVYVKVNPQAEYKLQTTSTSGNVRVNLNQIPNHGGYTDKTLTTTQVNGYTGNSDILFVQTVNGNLTVLDQ